MGAMEHYGVKVCERIPILVTPTVENQAYLKTKQMKMGHYLSIPDESEV